MSDTPVTKKDLEQLTASIAALTTAFETSDAFAQETRTIATKAEQASADARKASSDAKGAMVTTFIVALAVLMLIGFGFYLADRNADNKKLIDLRAEYQTATCMAGNESRAKEKKLWTDLIAADEALAAAEGIKISKEERAALDEVKANLEIAYPQRDCEQVKDGKLVDASPSPAAPTPVMPGEIKQKAKKTPSASPSAR